MSNYNRKMNTFLHGCCFIPPEDESTPSFSECSPHSIPLSRLSSGTSFDLRSLGSKEIFYIKPFSKEGWTNFEEEKASINSGSSSLQVQTGSTLSSPSTESRQRKKDEIIFMIRGEDNEHMSFWLCGSNRRPSMENCYWHFLIVSSGVTH